MVVLGVLVVQVVWCYVVNVNLIFKWLCDCCYVLDFVLVFFLLEEVCFLFVEIVVEIRFVWVIFVVYNYIEIELVGGYWMCISGSYDFEVLVWLIWGVMV